MSNLSQILPITVIAAIVLFAIKETIEFRRRKLDRARKRDAIALLMAEELQVNYWRFECFFRLLETLSDIFENHPNASYRLEADYYGSEKIRFDKYPDEGSWIGWASPSFVTQQYERLLPDIAQLHSAVFKTINETYDEIHQLEGYRKAVIAFIAGHDMSPAEILTKTFIAGLAEEREEYFYHLNSAYRALTGDELTEWKVK